jgi:hypothetical protein
MQMKNIKYTKIVVVSFLIGALLANVSFRKKSLEKDEINWIQYLNRLQEFCLYDLEGAKQEFISLINSGLNYEDAFNLTLISKAHREMVLGQTND